MKKGGIHYVYIHRDPITKECLYVGAGSKGRAWTMICSNKSHPTRYGHRSSEHAEHLETLTELGYVASDWVQIIAKALTKEEAHKIERGIIEDQKPKYNLVSGVKSKITKGQIKKMESLRKGGMSYKEIGKRVSLATMTVWRVLNDSPE